MPPNPATVVADDASDADQNEVEEPFNLSLPDFLYNWGMSAEANGDARRLRKGPNLSVLSKQRVEQLTPMQRKDLDGERCDFQRINWEELGVSRLEARQMRRNSYRNYQNLRYTNHVWHPRINGSNLDNDQSFFRFRRMDFDHNINLAHFQLRNLMACASRDHVFYAGRSKIMQWHPRSGSHSGTPSVAMDLTNPIVQPFHSNHQGIQISTLTVAHDILVAGGFNGEYAMVNLRLPQGARHTEGLITDHMNSITNHVQVHLSRGSALPLAAFASNDMGMRILDVNTNKFIAEHKYEHAINCTAISPDQRLRVLVGDTRDVMICNAETGEVLQSLEGHRDFGFACDWADDGWTVATGNQDMQIKIWDARMWKGSSGQATPLATIAAEMAGVRKLKFSPLGSGKRVLLAAEPADFISVIDADSFTCKQNLSFFGEIGGIDFTDGGRDVLVANCDSMRGGIMEFERCDFTDNDLFNLEEGSKRRRRCLRSRTGYDWVPDDDVVDHPKAQGTWQQRIRKAATLGVSLDHF
ncbi:WD40 repeat-like protein [Acephala macrosclerotiorum]|nr:WD40 repeat-like protein [Acephala macrosclerotiorum]